MLDMAEKKKSATFLIDEPTLAKLKESAEALGVSKGSIVRLCLEVGLANIEKSIELGMSTHAALAELEALKETPPEGKSR